MGDLKGLSLPRTLLRTRELKDASRQHNGGLKSW